MKLSYVLNKLLVLPYKKNHKFQSHTKSQEELWPSPQYAALLANCHIFVLRDLDL